MKADIISGITVRLDLSLDEYLTLRKLVYSSLGGCHSTRDSITNAMDGIDKKVRVDPELISPARIDGSGGDKAAKAYESEKGLMS